MRFGERRGPTARGFSLSEEEERKEEEEERPELASCDDIYAEDGIRGVQRRLVGGRSSNDGRRGGRGGGRGEAIEIKEKEGRRRRGDEATSTDDERAEKRTREQRKRSGYLEQMPWKSPRLTARSARRRQKKRKRKTKARTL